MLSYEVVATPEQQQIMEVLLPEEQNSVKTKSYKLS